MRLFPKGQHKLRFEFETTGKPDVAKGKGAPGRAQLYIDDKLVGQVEVPVTMPLSIGLAGGIVCGADTGSPVWDKYKPPFTFTGTIHALTVDVSRRADQRHRGRDAHGDGPTVARCARCDGCASWAAPSRFARVLRRPRRRPGVL